MKLHEVTRGLKNRFDFWYFELLELIFEILSENLCWLIMNQAKLIRGIFLIASIGILLLKLF